MPAMARKLVGEILADLDRGRVAPRVLLQRAISLCAILMHLLQDHCGGNALPQLQPRIGLQRRLEHRQLLRQAGDHRHQHRAPDHRRRDNLSINVICEKVEDQERNAQHPQRPNKRPQRPINRAKQLQSQPDCRDLFPKLVHRRCSLLQGVTLLRAPVFPAMAKY